jgi:hypothetical protein
MTCRAIEVIHRMSRVAFFDLWDGDTGWRAAHPSVLDMCYECLIHTRTRGWAYIVTAVFSRRIKLYFRSNRVVDVRTLMRYTPSGHSDQGSPPIYYFHLPLVYDEWCSCSRVSVRPFLPWHMGVSELQNAAELQTWATVYIISIWRIWMSNTPW